MYLLLYLFALAMILLFFAGAREITQMTKDDLNALWAGYRAGKRGDDHNPFPPESHVAGYWAAGWADGDKARREEQDEEDDRHDWVRGM